MPETAPLHDLVVLVPGVTGSKLSAGGKPVWSLSGKAIMRGVLSLGASVKALQLPAGFGDAFPVDDGEGEPSDGVKATGLMTDLHVIPGLWSPIKGYDQLAGFFLDTFSAIRAAPNRTGNLIAFPYDWRLSNAVSARRLKRAVLPVLEAWRERGQPDAKLVLVCHSMGGLVARWFLERLEGWRDTRWLITVGTPYQGSVKALDALVNGLSKGLGPLRADLTGLVRSFPSMYELLPTYPCYLGGGDVPQTLSDAGGPGLSSKMLESACTFHAELAAAIARRPERGYRTVAIKGVKQPTMQTARPGQHGLELLEEYKRVKHGGDGTVPRPSAHPPEWSGESDTIGASQRHAALQESRDVFVQLFTRLTTDTFGTWMGGEDIGVEVGVEASGEFEPTNLFLAGQPIVIRARSENEDVALQASASPHLKATSAPSRQLMTNLGGGIYQTVMTGIPPGTYQLTVGTAPTPVEEPVSDFIIVWDGDSE